jgi:2-phosphosulfolactate phosphatase
MRGKVVIDSFPESAARYKDHYAIVVVDVIRFCTTATTAVAQGRSVFPATTTDEAFAIAESLENPLMAGELGGNMPYGFHVNNSPAQIAARSDVERPMVLVSSSGSQLLSNAAGGEAVYAACLRNMTAIAEHIARHHERVAILGAGTWRQFRREDQMACAWIAEKLVASDFSAVDEATRNYLSRWSGLSPEEIRGGKSAEYLRRSQQSDDLEFILTHIDDLNVVPILIKGELVPASKTHRLQVAV